MMLEIARPLSTRVCTSSYELRFQNGLLSAFVPSWGIYVNATVPSWGITLVQMGWLPESKNNGLMGTAIKRKDGRDISRMDIDGSRIEIRPGYGSF